MTRSLENLLVRLRGGDVRPGDRESAASLVAGDARIPDELRAELFRSDDDVAADAAGVLALLGLDDLGAVLADGIRAEAAQVGLSELEADDAAWAEIAAALVEGLRAESAQVDVAEAVSRRLPLAAFAHGGLVAPAVAGEAGAVEVAAEVAAAIGASSLPVADAVRAEAGSIDLADAVLAALALPSVDVAGAVRSEAGSVDVVAEVMARVGAWRADDAPVTVAPVANGSRWSFAGFAMAAALLVSVVVSRFESPALEVPPVVAVATQAVFAHAGEVVIEDLQYDANVQVIQTEGDDGAVILWIDEEA
jgi:hypothetical protein